MTELRPEPRSGLAAVEAITALLQRARNAHPTKGLFEAAELQWFWGRERSTDACDQLFWFDSDDNPVAGIYMADFTTGGSALYEEVTLATAFMPDASPDLMGEVLRGTLAVAHQNGIANVELEVDRDDTGFIDVVTAHGFTKAAEGALQLAWVAADQRADVSPLADGYQLTSRAATAPRPHHMNERNPAFDEHRLLQTSLYRPDFDLVVVDADESYAGYGIFWYDPVTATGVVEPMRTKDEHQQKGIARHILTAGLDLLAAAGATRISIGYEPENPASGHLYRSVGFVDDMLTDVYSGPTAPDAS